MAKPLQPIAIQAPGFYGLNTQDSPTGLTEQFALEANNCVIDRFGRIGARKGYQYTVNSTGAIVSLHEHINADATGELISTTESAIFKGTTTLTDITPSGYTVSDGLYKSATLNNVTYMYNKREKPLYFDGTTCALVEDHPDVSGTVPRGDVPLAAFGRLWVGDGTILYFSDLLIGAAWDTGSSGSVDVSKVWSGGSDVITGLATHNNFLFVFGRRQIIVYQGASDPATMSLADNIVNIGCIEHDTIKNTGSDLIFLSDTGVRSINRLIQEKSAPLGDLTRNVRTELGSYLDAGYSFNSVYSPKEAFYLLNIKGAGIVYCLDMRGNLEDGSSRVTKWDSINPQSLVHRTVENDVLIGRAVGIAEYKGHKDGVEIDGSGGVPYKMSYFTNYLDFGAPSNLKMLKSLKITFIGGSDTPVTLNYGYDYSFAYKKRAFVLPEQNIAEFGIAEYGVGEYNQGILVNRPSVNASSAGSVVQLGVDVDINGSPISIQRITAQAVLGRVL
jgi:hypothetical protein